MAALALSTAALPIGRVILLLKSIQATIRKKERE